MNRRAYLSLVSAGVSVGVSGCQSRDYDMSNGIVTCTDERTHTPLEESELDPVEGVWPSAHFDARNTGYDPDGTGPAGCPTTQWTFLLEDEGENQSRNSVRIPPVVAGGAVYTGRHSTFAVEARSGGRRWKSETSGGFGEGVVVADGYVYLAKNMGVYALDEATGSANTLMETNVHIQTPPTVVDDTVYVGIRDGSVLAVDGSGGERWRRDLNESDESEVEVSGSPAVADATVFVGTRGETFHALNATTGEPRWARSLDSSIWGAPVVGDELVFVPEEYAIKAFRTDDGATEWELFGGDDGYVVGSPALADGTLYVQAGPYLEEIQLLALDAATGDRLWGRPIGRPEASPVVVDGTVYLDAGRDLVALDAENGEPYWSVRPGVTQPGSDIHEPVAVVDGVVFLAATSAGLLAIA